MLETQVAPALRTIGDELVAHSRSPRIPADMFSLSPERRLTIRTALYDFAAVVEAEPGSIEIELVSPEQSPYTLEESREIFYLVRTALAV